VQNVQRITPFLRDIVAPAPLRDMPFWLCWRLEPFAGEAKPRKVPYYPSGERRHGVQGSPNDVAKLTTFAVARDEAMKRGMEGVGFAHTAAGGVVTLDFDNCVTDGKVRQDVFDLVNMTYAEFSPSGNGIHAIFFGDPEILKNHKVGTQGDDFAVEAFSSAGFTTFTGRVLDHVDVLGYEDRIAPLPPFVAEACLKRFGARTNNTFDPDDFMAGREPRLGLTVTKMQNLLAVLDPSMGRDQWLRIGMALHHETDGDDTGFELWDDWSSDGDTYPTTEALRNQWDGFKGGTGKKLTTMRSVIKMAKEAGYREPDNREAVLAKAEVLLAELPSKSLGRFGPVPIYDLTLTPPMDWLIKGVLPRGELGVLFGASGSGKTFVALDLAFSVARGIAWRERRTTRGRVAIIAAEGGAGIGKRGEAYARYHDFNLQGVDVHVITAAPNFLDSDDVSEVIAELNNIGPVDLVIVDTFAQVTPGANENTSEDVGRALANLKLLHEATRAMNLVVAHAGKDLSKGVRGWSGLKAAADVQIEVVRHENGDREIIIEKMKDGEDGIRWAFRLEVVEVGIDYDGDIITSCVAVPTELQAKVEQERIGLKRRGRVENHVLEIMTLFGDQSIVAAVDLIDRAVAALQAPEDGKRDTRRQSVTRAIHALSKEKDGPLRLEGGKIIFYE
jgi:KaiC/GvpD/RAD55 family RecA-like ATPase